MGPCCNAGWAKLDKYYTLTEESAAYVAAVVMDPSQKWSHFEEMWAPQPTWLPKHQELIKNVWLRQYNPTVDEPEFSKDSLSKNSYVRHLQKRAIDRAPKDEYQLYLSTPPITACKDPRAWWSEPTQLQQFPYLSKMAFDFLTIPAMSDDAERVFSAAKRTLTDGRGQLKAETLQWTECLKSWLGMENWVDLTEGEDEEESGSDAIVTGCRSG
jgi:hypothetical protein